MREVEPGAWPSSVHQGRGCPVLAGNRGRPAYTLLEVLVASAVGVLLMGALYMAISVQLRHAQIGRDLLEQSLLSRALLARMDKDIRLSLGPPLPAASGSSGGGGASSMMSGGGSGSSGASGATGASSTGTGGNTGSNSTASSTSGASSATSTSGSVQFNLWVQGDTSWIMLYISRVPRELTAVTDSDSEDQPLSSDLRRVSYWLAGGADSPLGLARQEVAAVTSDQEMAVVPPGIPDEASMVIAEEVKSLQFSYFDGNAWQDTWDGTAAGPDGSTPVGPPLAIAITLGIASDSGSSGNADQPLKLYRHVVPLVTANGATQLTTGGTSTP
jgi:hypothetical protein